MRRHDHPFVLQLCIAPVDERDDVAVGNDVAIDGRVEIDASARQRERREAARRLGGPRQLLERFPRAGDERCGEGGRNLRDRNVDAVGPRRQRINKDARGRFGPDVARRRLEVRRARMVVHVADEQHRARPLLLRREHPPPQRRPLGRHDAVEWAVRIALARLVVEREHDPAPHVAVVVVVLQPRRRDAEAGEHDVAGRAAARADALRVEILTRPQMAAGAVRHDDVERVAVAERRGHQVVPLEVRIVRRGRLQTHALEPRADEIGGGAVLLGVGQPSAQRVAREKEQIGAQIVLPDRVVLRRERRGGDRGGDEQRLQHGAII